MTDESTTWAPAPPSLRAFAGTVLLALGGMLFVNLNEDPELFVAFSAAFAGPGLYLLISAAVTRGIAHAGR